MGFVKNALKVIKPLVSMVNPLLGAAVGFASNLMQGKNPLQSLLGAAGDLIPGGLGGAFGSALSKFGGSSLMEGMGGNSLLSGALNLAKGKSKVTDIAKDLLKATQKKEEMTEQSRQNTLELMAQRMGQLLQ